MEILTAEELLAWNDTTAQRWRALLESNPEALNVSCDVRGSSNVADLLQHIVAVELRYAERLCGEAVTEYADVSKDSVAALYATHDRAMEKFRRLLKHPAYPWEEEIDLKTRSEGTLLATRRAVFAHALLHSVRHYAQLATLLRHHGVVADWPMDFLFMSARR